MTHHYYIDTNGAKDGPHDLVTIMRRIRTGKVTRDTLIYHNGEETPSAAHAIHDIALFFEQEPAVNTRPVFSLRLRDILSTGWHFTAENNVMTVYAGALLIVSLLIGLLLLSLMEVLPGLLLGWCVFLTLHNLYFVFLLRIYRRQSVSVDFIHSQVVPVLATLVPTSIVLGLMTAGGALLLLIPGIIVAALYIFVPFLLLDYRFQLVEALHASRLLLQKHNRRYLTSIMMLVALHLVCVALIIPIPLTLPLFAASLAAIYEELSLS